MVQRVKLLGAVERDGAGGGIEGLVALTLWRGKGQSERRTEAGGGLTGAVGREEWERKYEDDARAGKNQEARNRDLHR